MAVPIPKRKNNTISHKCNINKVSLEYTGKKDVQDILSLPIGHFIQDSQFPLNSNNRLYHTDNIHALSTLFVDENIKGNIQLVYIDPPFATDAIFESRQQDYAYDDTLTGYGFLECLRERLVFIYNILADNGSLYLHLDERMIFHVKIILDEIFGASNYRNCITRKKCNPKNYTRKTYGNIVDYILFYTKSDSYIWNRPLEPWDEERACREYQYIDEDGRRFKKVPVHAPGIRNGETGKPWRGVMPPPGKHWQYPPSKLDEMDKRGEIFWSSNGNPRKKIYLENSNGIPLQNIWLDVKDAHNQNIKVTGYPTEKNFDLLCRLIEASSNPGDIILDCYAGSGTTLEAAEKLGRNWIGMDNSVEAIKTIIERFKYGTKPMGDFVKNNKQIPIPCLPLREVSFTLFREISYLAS